MEHQLRKVLAEIVGPERFLDKIEDRLSYAYDADVREGLPDAVILPNTTDEVSRIMSVASAHRIPVTARGAGSNLCGASVPVNGGLVLSFVQMDRVIEVNTRDRYCIVQPGVVNGDLQKVLGREGFFFPPDPGSMAFSTIGGNVAQNAGGPRCLKYGVTVDYVSGMEVVLADGEIIRFGSRNVKDVTGYRLSGLFCGSEGTLGIITEIILRVIPLPEAHRTVLAAYDNLDDTAATVSAVIGEGILPAAMELLDNVVINAVEDAFDVGLPREAEGMLLVEVDGNKAAVEKEMNRIVAVARSKGARSIQEARTTAERDRLWQARRAAYSVFSRLAPDCIVEDATVPVSRVPEMIRGMREIMTRHRLQAGILAHAGDGNMHPMIATDRRNAAEWQRVEAACEEIFQLATALNGTLSGEHGIGLAKIPYLPMALDDATRRFMAAIKRTADPHGILNPGKAI